MRLICDSVIGLVVANTFTLADNDIIIYLPTGTFLLTRSSLTVRSGLAHCSPWARSDLYIMMVVFHGQVNEMKDISNSK